jgi:hypothetical protein
MSIMVMSLFDIEEVKNKEIQKIRKICKTQHNMVYLDMMSLALVINKQNPRYWNDGKISIIFEKKKEQGNRIRAKRFPKSICSKFAMSVRKYTQKKSSYIHKLVNFS